MDIKEWILDPIKAEDRRHPWEASRAKVCYALLTSALKDLATAPLTFLDIGCGDAFLTRSFAKKLPHCTFIAVDHALTGHVADQIQSFGKEDNVHYFPSLDQALASVPDRKIDVVLLLDVLEHIEDDVQFLKDLVSRQQHIVAGTTFLITVPSFQGLYSAHDMFLGHYRRYDLTSLLNNLSAVDLKVHKRGYFFSSLLLPRALELGMQKIFPRRKQAPSKLVSWRSSGVWTTMVRWFLYFDFKISRLLERFFGIPGLSTYAVCKK